MFFPCYAGNALNNIKCCLYIRNQNIAVSAFTGQLPKQDTEEEVVDCISTVQGTVAHWYFAEKIHTGHPPDHVMQHKNTKKAGFYRPRNHEASA